MKTLITTLLVATTTVFGQAAPAKPAVKTAAAPLYKTLKYPPLKEVQIPKVEQFTLPNGMKVLLLENNELPLVSGSMLIRTGALLEPADKAGLASITGSVLRSGGTKKRSGDALNERLESMAASIESSIGDESGRVGFSCLKENLEEVLALFKEVATEPAFSKERFDLEITQTKSSISRRNDDSNSILRREFSNLIYGKDTPYGERVEYATIGNIKREDLIAFHDRYYFPANAILSIQGDINAAELKTKLQALFADWTVTRPAVPAFPKVTKQKTGGVFVADKPDSEQTFFIIGQLGGKRDDKDYPTLDVMSDILGGGFSSRLYQKVRSDNSLAYTIYSAWNADYIHEGTFFVGGSTNAATTEQAISLSLKEVKRIREEMVGPTELEAAKQRVANSFVFNFDSPSKTLGRLVANQYYGYPTDWINQYKDAVMKVTAQDILKAAQQYVKPEEFSILAVGPVAKMGDSLKALGEVKKLDISIPQPKQDTAKEDSASLAKGKATMAKIADAVGGLAKLSAVKDYVQTLESELAMGGNKIKVKQVNMWLKPAGFRQESEFPFGKVIAFFDGEKGFIKSPQGEQPLVGPFAAQVQGQLRRDYFAIMLSNETAGRTVNFVKDGELELKDAAGALLKLSYDPATFLPSKLAFTEGPANAEIAYQEFKEVDGVKVPMKSAITQMNQTTIQVVTDWKLNTGLTMEKLGAK
jgi:zinc protease